MYSETECGRGHRNAYSDPFRKRSGVKPPAAVTRFAMGNRNSEACRGETRLGDGQEGEVMMIEKLLAETMVCSGGWPRPNPVSKRLPLSHYRFG